MGTEVEEVLVVPRTCLEETGLLFQGFRLSDHDELGRLVVEHGMFMNRDQAEEDPNWKQIIPYALIQYDGLTFLMRRSKKGGESRLHDRLSIGVGGHINREPGEKKDWILTGLQREISEEVEGGTPYKILPFGLLNDDSNEVGQVHYGAVFVVIPENDSVKVRETELLKGEFVSLEELGLQMERMETWSQWITRDLISNPQWLQSLA